ncbi:MAG TPA: hypothetical protein VEF72_27965 [Mycobacterium sp.]|nr:hypothetical protein [Mycobacterium sp.]
MAATVTINDVLDGHVVLDVECLDRIYANGYVPNLQAGRLGMGLRRPRSQTTRREGSQRWPAGQE